MKLRKTKKGFTIVELVIVIAVIAILAAILIPTFASLTQKANVASDQSLKANLNTALRMQEAEDGEKNATMHDAVLDLDKQGFNLERITTKSNLFLLWDEDDNQFVLEDGQTPNIKLWKIVNDPEEAKNEENFSVYARQGDAWAGQTVLPKNGFDAGYNANISKVNYTNTQSGKEVVIRTNSASTNLTIDDASTGTINHYGSAGALNIIQCHTSSYHENGNVAFAEIAKGRIVLENGSKIDRIHVNKKENVEAFDTVIITDNGAKALPEKITRDEVTVTVATQVVVVEPKGAAAETVYVYADGSTGHIGTTEKTETQNTNVESALGQLVLDNGSSGDKALTEEQKEESKEVAIEEAKDNEKADESVKVTINDASTLMSLAEFRDNVNADVEGYKTASVELMCNVNLGGFEWTPIKEFSGVFDGKGYAISNYIVSTPNDKTGTGLFKKLIGEVNNDFNNKDDVYNKTTHEFLEGKISENKYTCVVKNLKLSNVTTNANHGVSNSRFTAGLVGIAVNAYISNIEVSNSTINVYKYGSAVVGSMSGTVIKDVNIASDVTVIGTGAGAGHVAGVVGESGNSQGTRINAIVNATNNATITGYYGNNAGIGALAKGVVYYNCINNGTINLSNDNNACGGICGNGDGSWFIMCTNNGNINAINHFGQIAGIVGYMQNAGGSCFYKAYNYGNISNAGDNATSKLAGISFDGNTTNNYEDVANYGILSGEHAEAIYDISSNTSLSLIIADSMTFAELVDELNISSANSVTISATITGELGTLVLPANTRVFSATSTVATKFDLSQLAGNSVTINMPGNYELVNISGKSISIAGNSNVTVGSSENGGSVSLKGQVASLTNNGTLEHVYFGGTGVYTLTNNGTISYTQKESDIYGNKHTIDSITACTITIHNYGTIEAKKNSNDVCSYALLFYNGSNVTFYAYENSTVRCDALNHYLLATTSNSTVTFLYQEGAHFINGTSEYSYPPFHSENVIVSKIN